MSEELIRVAILWHELWHEGLEEASRLYFGERNIKGMFAVLEPLHQMMEDGPQTLKESAFSQVSTASSAAAAVHINSLHVSVRLDVKRGGTNCNRCTQRIAILHAQTYLIAHQKPDWSEILCASKLPTEKWAFSSQLSIIAHGVLVVLDSSLLMCSTLLLLVE